MGDIQRHEHLLVRDEEGYLEARTFRPVGRDAEGDLEAGDLGGGAYGAFEGDLGEKIRPLAGFGRDLEPVEEEEIWDGVTFTPEGHSTKPVTSFYTIDWERSSYHHAVDWGAFVRRP